jgi:flavin reductase (DIM6/NTAB) family NADH-FMN oxidoreductase RutF
MSVDSGVPVEDFRRAMSSWVTGVSIVTGKSSDPSNRPVGIVCNSLASISLEKRLILWSVDKSSSSYAHWIKAESFLVHFLSADQQDLVKKFAAKGTDKFAGISFQLSELGNPILEGASVRMECLTSDVFDTFDHSLIVGTVMTLEDFQRPPMIFLHSKLRAVEE